MVPLSDWLGCDRLCQPVSTEFVYVRPRRPVRLRCCLCQTQERGAAGNAELVHTGALWCTLEHSGAESTRQDWRTPLCGSCLCGCGGSFPRSVARPPPDRRYLPEREKMQFLGEDESIKGTKLHTRIPKHNMKDTQL